MKSLLTVATIALFTSTAQAASFKLDANGAEPLYQTTLTKEVYQNSNSDFLQDLFISNANGESVPYSLVTYEDIHEPAVSEETKPLAIFPMQKDMLNQAGVNIQFNHHGNDTRVNVIGDNSKTVSKTYYLFDLGEKHPSFKRLLLDWQGQEGKLLTVDVLMSNDLKNWMHAGQGAVLNVSTNEQSIIQNSISLDKVVNSRYLQILPQDATESFQLTSVHVEFNQTQALSQPHLWQEISYLNREQNNAVTYIDFESQSRVPATLLNIALPQKNTITQAVIYVRNDKDQPWRRITSASLYHLNKLGKNYHNPDIHIPSTTARYWRLSFNQTSGGIGQDNPKLSLGWSPAIIVWNARGADPFNLQVGQAGNNNINTISISQLIKPYDAKKIRQLPIANLSLISQAQHFNAWESPRDFKRFWLWTGLFIGVFALALMAYSLLKNNSKS